MQSDVNIQTVTEQMQSILDVFSVYLENQPISEFIFTRKFGLLCVTLWSEGLNTSYDVTPIPSVADLCEALMDMMVSDYLYGKDQLCIDRHDMQIVYTEHIQKYVQQLPEYQELLYSKLENVLATAKCSK